MREFNGFAGKEIISICQNCSGNMRYKGSGCYQCESCGEEYLTDFGKVKRFINTYGPSNAITISKETGVSRHKIRRFLQEGRVEIVEDGSSEISFCLSCGTPLRSGMYCNVCQGRMSGATSHSQKGVYNSLSGDKMESQEGQMRFKNEKE